jgi:hypothetical protein
MFSSAIGSTLSLKRWPGARAVALSIVIGSSLAPLYVDTAASQSDGSPESRSTSYVQTFDGIPLEPTPWQPPDWDISVHSRDRGTWQTLQPMQAMHGDDCSAPPAHHDVQTGERAVFQCNDHVMTAINADGYGVVYLTPNQQVDFSAGEAVVRFDLSTLRTSTRDWVDLWVTPYEDNRILPLDRGLPDLNGEPRRAIHVRMGTFNAGTIFGAEVVRDFEVVQVRQVGWTGYESFLQPSAVRRDTFELRISRTRVKFGMPAYNTWWVDGEVADLGWDRGVVQLGHHSYTPTKECPAGAVCGPNTWHWDNVSIAPAVPFTMAKGDRRYVDPTSPAIVAFAAPAPAGAHLRFAALGDAVDVSFDGGSRWEPARLQAHLRSDPASFQSYWTPVPAGTGAVQFRARGGWWGSDWMVRDPSLWSPNPPGEGEGAQPEGYARSDVGW